MPADPALTQSRPSVPDLKTGYCIHHPACTECGEHHFQPRAGECRDCIDLALAAAREEGAAKEHERFVAYRAETRAAMYEAANDLAAARERIAELLSLCPACGGRGWHEDHAHDPGCDGSCRNCPVAVQVECNCIGAIRAALTANDAKEAERGE